MGVRSFGKAVWPGAVRPEGGSLQHEQRNDRDRCQS